MGDRSMTRRQSVAFFLGDVGFLSDPKFRRLARLLTDPDDFNSAVGAYWIALAASRRNGSHAVDVEAETDSKFIDQLRAVGLLDEQGFPEPSWKTWAATSPQQAMAGRARAISAERDEKGHFLPSAGPSDPSALDRSSSAVQPSPPIPSNQLTTKGGAGENVAPSAVESPHSRRVNDRVWERRIEWYRQTGEWPEEYGPKPEISRVA